MNIDSSLKINSHRLWESLMEMAKIGKTTKGGCNRQAVTQLDKEGRDLFVKDCKDIGCEILIDEVGNIFARKEGTNADLPAVIMGSHLDTQPTGGRFDGVYGVLAGLEVLRTIHETNTEHAHSIEVVVWTNEEGSRFSPACLGSGVWNGSLSKDEIYKALDSEGLNFKDELNKIGYLGSLPASPRPIKASFEAHIEQGPILENEKKQIGIVTGIQGLRWYDLTLKGFPCHAGPSPMEGRQDPVQAMLPILECCYDMAKEKAPWGRATIGRISASPGSPNTVPESIKISIDLRHPKSETVEWMDTVLRAKVDSVCSSMNIDYELKETWRMEVTTFDSNCIDAVRNSTKELGFTSMEMVSGAGHDSLYISERVPTSMIFIPCENGLSHNEAENVTQEDVEAGANVLLHSVLNMSK